MHPIRSERERFWKVAGARPISMRGAVRSARATSHERWRRRRTLRRCQVERRGDDDRVEFDALTNLVEQHHGDGLLTVSICTERTITPAVTAQANEMSCITDGEKSTLP
ncbi:MAG: hypothetical protein ABI887_09820, partial [Burkholderiales bacterium]